MAATVNRIEKGNTLVKGAGDVMDEIVRSVQRVSELVENISLASHEQNAGIDQVNVAVTQMDAATQQNAALSQQSAAAAQSMQAQAHRLLETVSVFRPGKRDEQLA